MKTTEKIASLYLRLNGFLLMPHFTVLGIEKERHVDILGIRVGGSQEKVGEIELSVDTEFVKLLGGPEADIKLWAEVGTGDRIDLFPERKEEYCKSILGAKDKLQKIYFDFDKLEINLISDARILTVPAGRCRKIILERFSQMESEQVKKSMKKMTKVGSWTWSEEFLADLLYLRKIGFLKDNTQCSC